MGFTSAIQRWHNNSELHLWEMSNIILGGNIWFLCFNVGKNSYSACIAKMQDFLCHWFMTGSDFDSSTLLLRTGGSKLEHGIKAAIAFLISTYAFNLKNIFKVASFLQMFWDDCSNNPTEKTFYLLDKRIVFSTRKYFSKTVQENSSSLNQ